MELGPGVLTPGWFDLRSVVDRLPWPDLTGARCLDVGTFDGFWAFEMERRKAAEVIAIDVDEPGQWDWPIGSAQRDIDAIGERKARGDGFVIAREALGSCVERLNLNVYDLDPAEVGMFDLVYVGSIMIHLRDPVLALQRVRSVCRGHLLSVDTVDPILTLLHPALPVAALDGKGRPWWWRPNVAGHRRMVEDAGFAISATKQVRMPPGAGQRRVPLSWQSLSSREGRIQLRDSRIGDPHSVVLARPSSHEANAESSS